VRARQDDKVLARLRKNVNGLASKVAQNTDLSRGVSKAPKKIKNEHGQEALENALSALTGLKSALDHIEKDAAWLIDAKERRPTPS
jgi:predicted RNase H-like nuclease (RuvC/YqgF family)